MKIIQLQGVMCYITYLSLRPDSSNNGPRTTRTLQYDLQLTSTGMCYGYRNQHLLQGEKVVTMDTLLCYWTM